MPTITTITTITTIATVTPTAEAVTGSPTASPLEQPFQQLAALPRTLWLPALEIGRAHV